MLHGGVWQPCLGVLEVEPKLEQDSVTLFSHCPRSNPLWSSIEGHEEILMVVL